MLKSVRFLKLLSITLMIFVVGAIYLQPNDAIAAASSSSSSISSLLDYANHINSLWLTVSSKWLEINKYIENTIGFSPATIISFFAKVIVWILELAVSIIQFIIRGLKYLIPE